MRALCAVCLFANHDVAVVFARAAAGRRQMMRFLNVTDLADLGCRFRSIVVLLPSLVCHDSPPPNGSRVDAFSRLLYENFLLAIGKGNNLPVRPLCAKS